MAATSGSTTGTKIDLGTVVKAAEGSWGVLKRLSQEITDEKRMQYLTFHWKPSESDILHSHEVTKGKKTWKVSFQSKWLKQFPWLCYSNLLEGGICSHCILFPHKVTREQHQVYWSQHHTRNRTLRHLARMASSTVMSNL